MGIIDILVIISLALFYILFIGRSILLYAKGVKVWVIGTSTKKIYEIILEHILPPVLLVWCVLIIITALHITVPALLSQQLIAIKWLQYIGITLCYGGLLIFALALVSFGKAWRIGIDEKDSNELITSGIFKYSRNPIFLFMDLYFTGILLLYPTVVFILMTIGTVTGIHLQILREEQFLLHKFGETYRAYTKRTRRYI